MKIYPLFILVTLISCSTGRSIVNTTIEDIHFGSGGGFTGKEHTYCLNSAGKLSFGEKNLKQIDLKKTLLLFKEAKQFQKYSFNEPQNTYSFIVIRSKDSMNRIVWSQGSKKIDTEIADFYNELMSLTK